MTSRAPVGYSIRAATRDDLGAIGDLMTASDVADLGHPDYTEDQIRDDWGRLGSTPRGTPGS